MYNTFGLHKIYIIILIILLFVFMIVDDWMFLSLYSLGGRVFIYSSVKV